MNDTQKALAVIVTTLCRSDTPAVRDAGHEIVFKLVDADIIELTDDWLPYDMVIPGRTFDEPSHFFWKEGRL